MPWWRRFFKRGWWWRWPRSRIDPKSGLYVKFHEHYHHHSIFIENIYTKIANDIALAKFKHVKITRIDDGPDKMDWLESSDISYILNRRPNRFETPTVFWTRVVKQMLKHDFAVVVPIYTNGKIESIELAEHIERIDRNFIYIIQCSTNGKERTEKKYRIDNCWIFENPRMDLSQNLNQMLHLINLGLERLYEKLGTEAELMGFLKVQTMATDDTLLKRIQKRVRDIYIAASQGGIGFLQQGEEFQELNKTFNTASMDEINLLKQQLANAYGINDSLLNCTYDEMTYRAYQQTILTPFLNVIREEINYKQISKTAYTQGQRILVYYDYFNITSLKDLSDFAFRMKYSGIMNSNEVREIFGYGGYVGGDTYESNANAVPIKFEEEIINEEIV